VDSTMVPMKAISENSQSIDTLVFHARLSVVYHLFLFFVCFL
jgi:hypothetical protein